MSLSAEGCVCGEIGGGGGCNGLVCDSYCRIDDLDERD